MGSKNSNIDGKSEWTVRGTMLKSKPHLVTAHKNLSQPMNFLADPCIFGLDQN